MKGIKLKNFSNYWIFPELGMIWSLYSNRWIGSKMSNGYWKLTMTNDDGVQCDFLIHRLIWEAVNGAIPEGMEINHLDENPSNNVISNLSCVSHLENVRYGTCIQRARNSRDYKKMAEKRSRQVGAFINDILVFTFPSTMEAQRAGYQSSAISNCCNGKRQLHKGYTWRYLN